MNRRSAGVIFISIAAIWLILSDLQYTNGMRMLKEYSSNRDLLVPLLIGGLFYLIFAEWTDKKSGSN